MVLGIYMVRLSVSVYYEMKVITTNKNKVKKEIACAISVQ